MAGPNVLIEMGRLSLHHPGPDATPEERAAFFEAKAVLMDHLGLPLLALQARKHASEEAAKVTPTVAVKAVAA